MIMIMKIHELPLSTYLIKKHINITISFSQISVTCSFVTTDVQGAMEFPSSPTMTASSSLKRYKGKKERIKSRKEWMNSVARR